MRRSSIASIEKSLCRAQARCPSEAVAPCGGCDEHAGCIAVEAHGAAADTLPAWSESEGAVVVASGRLSRAAAPFTIPDFRRIWLGAVCYSFGQWTERIAIGWFVFDLTDSAFMTAVAIAAQSAPNVVFGPIAGAVSDRYPRPRVLAASAVVKAIAITGVASLVAVDGVPLWMILVLVAVSGTGMTFSVAPLYTLSGDLVGAARRPNAIALVSTGQRAVAAIGALSGGVIVGMAGAAWGFVFAAAAFMLAALVYRSAREPAERVHVSQASFFSETFEGLRLVLRVPTVAVLIALMVVVEVFGFSYVALLPALSDRVLGVGAVGLGGLSGAAGVGSVVGVLFLAAYGDRLRHGLLFLGVFAAFGALLIALASSQTYVVSLGIAAGIGMCAALVDALEWIMLQASVDDRLRGRALGAWNMAIGFGWIGPLILGAVGDAASIPTAYSIAGAILLGGAALSAIAFPRLRAA